MPLSQKEIDCSSQELPKGHWQCIHAKAGTEIAGLCTKCDKDVCHKCIGAHTCLGHEVVEVVQ